MKEIKSPSQKLLEFLHERFDLSLDTEDYNKTIESIKAGVPFRGTNLWVLIFAIFVASIGLNTNSTAVIIGAMLISPLMGPIMGVGLGLGIYDFNLVKKALYNLAIATAIAMFTSFIYFYISPISDAQSEILARTRPSLYDVLIALFGGLAGIVASTRKEKGNVIPGVAIATALMPPLCTAGYGLATGQWNFFAGAFYLYLINCVFICLATLLIVRYLKYPHYSFVDEKTEKRIQRIISIILLGMLIPSIWLAFNLVMENRFENAANKFIEEFIETESTLVIEKTINYKSDSSLIELTLLGDPIDEYKEMDIIKQAQVFIGFPTKIKLKQDAILNPLKLGKSEISRESLQEALIQKENELRSLKYSEDSLKTIVNLYYPEMLKHESIIQEIQAQMPEIIEMEFGNINKLTKEGQIIINPRLSLFSNRPINSEQKERLIKWLKIRLQIDEMDIEFKIKS